MWARRGGAVVHGVTFPPESIRWKVIDGMLYGAPIRLTLRWSLGSDQCPVDRHRCEGAS